MICTIVMRARRKACLRIHTLSNVAGTSVHLFLMCQNASALISVLLPTGEQSITQLLKKAPTTSLVHCFGGQGPGYLNNQGGGTHQYAGPRLRCREPHT